MNSSYSNASQNQDYLCYGSLALQASEERPRLRVVEGGRTDDAPFRKQEGEFRSRVRGLVLVAMMVCAVSLVGVAPSRRYSPPSATTPWARRGLSPSA